MAKSNSSLASGAPFGDPLVGFSDFFTFRSDFKNSGFFGTAQKDQKVNNEVPKVSLKSTLGPIQMDFQSHFGIGFSTFSENGESVLSAAGRSCSAERATGVFELGILLD